MKNDSLRRFENKMVKNAKRQTFGSIYCMELASISQLYSWCKLINGLFFIQFGCALSLSLYFYLSLSLFISFLHYIDMCVIFRSHLFHWITSALTFNVSRYQDTMGRKSSEYTHESNRLWARHEVESSVVHITMKALSIVWSTIGFCEIDDIGKIQAILNLVQGQMIIFSIMPYFRLHKFDVMILRQKFKFNHNEAHKRKMFSLNSYFDTDCCYEQTDFCIC